MVSMHIIIRSIMDKVRYGVVGIGNMGSAHAKGIFEGLIEGAVLTAVADRDEERLKWARENFGDTVKVFSDHKELLSSGLVDAILIATPHYDHPTIATDALNAGIHVLTEKPAGVRASDVRLMNEAATKSEASFGIMFNQRTDPLFSALKYYVEIGLLGTIKRSVWIINNWYRSQAYYDSAGWRAKWKSEGGGVLLNQCPHNLDLWQWIVGFPEKIHAFCREGQFHDISVEDDVTIYTEYENGATGVFVTSTGEYPGTNRLEISGTMGKAVAEDGVLKLYLLDRDEREMCFTTPIALPHENVTKITLKFPPTEDGHILILKNFTRHILYGDDLIAPGTDGIKSLMISNAAYLSSERNATLTLPVDEEEFTAFLNKKISEETGRDTAIKKEQIKKENFGTYSERWSVRW